MTTKEVSIAFNIKYDTVRRIMYDYNRKGKLKKNQSGGRKRKKLNQNEISFIQAEVDENCWITLKVIKQKINQNFNKDVSERTISKYIGEFNYTLKRITSISERGVTETNNENRKLFCLNFLQLYTLNDPNNIFFQMRQVSTSV